MDLVESQIKQYERLDTIRKLLEENGYQFNTRSSGVFTCVAPDGTIFESSQPVGIQSALDELQELLIDANFHLLKTRVMEL